MIFNKEMTTREILEQLFDIYGIDDENTPLVINENDSETRKALKRAMNEQIFKKRQQDFLSGETVLKNFVEDARQEGAISPVFEYKTKKKVPNFYIYPKMYDLTDSEIIEVMKPKLAKIEGDPNYVYIDTMCNPTIGNGENLYDENGIEGKPFYDIKTKEALKPEQEENFKQRIVQERQKCFDIRAQHETEAERKQHLYKTGYYEKIFGQYRVPEEYVANQLHDGLESRIKTLRQHFKNNNVDYDNTPANIKMLYLDRYFNSGKLPFNHPGVLEKHRNKDWTSIPAIFRTNIVSQDRLDYQNKLANQPTIIYKIKSW